MNTFNNLVKKLSKQSKQGLWQDAIETIDQLQELYRQEQVLEDELDAQQDKELA